jgi:hypothetical protein
LDYLIHGSSGWGCVSGIFYPRVGPKGFALVRFLCGYVNRVLTADILPCHIFNFYFILWNTDKEKTEREIAQSTSSETDLTVVLNAWYSAGFYTGK